MVQFLLDQVVLDRIAFDEIFLEDRVRPDTELGASLGLDPVAYGDDYVEIVEDYVSSLRFAGNRSVLSGCPEFPDNHLTNQFTFPKDI